MVRKTPLVLAFCALLAGSPQAFASQDMIGCYWGDDNCLLEGSPALTPDNDSRDNLLRLLSEAKSFAVPVQSMPADITRSRDFYFDYHPQWDDITTPEPVATQNEDKTLTQQLAELQISPPPFSRQKGADEELENRYVSNNRKSVSQFISALMADPTLNSDQRRLLAQARINLWDRPAKAQIAESLSALPAGSTALLYKTYLTGAAYFYNQNYASAGQDFTFLIESKHPWLEETAQYMLMRTALNKSTHFSTGEYGDFDIEKINQQFATQARDEAHRYLQRWPQGMYADSARGMLRRINWYMQDWPQLAVLYEQAFDQATNPSALRELVIEYDNVFGRQYNESALRTAYPDAPLVSYIEMLRAIRLNNEQKPALTLADLDSSKPVFEKSGKLALWRDLQLNLWIATDNFAAVVQAVTPAQKLPTHDLLAFSEQTLYGEALMGQKKWAEARDFWQQLLRLSQDNEQQQYVQARLAATLVYSGDVAAIFAPDSAVTNLRFRSRILKTQASPELLRQQATQGANNEERTIALHTLLIRDLTENRFSDWLADKKIASRITPPLIDKAFDDVNLSVFDWNGDAVEAGYVCRSLGETVQVLSKNANDAHALNCLGEFFRTTEAKTDLWNDGDGNDILEKAISRKASFGQYDRQSYYQQIIALPQAEPEDKSYALYRAIICYAPSGTNDCGGEDVDELQRKEWFTQLKTQYPGSLWAQKLKYYW